MKKLLYVLLSVLFLTTGCLKDDESYSLHNMWVGFGMVEQLGSNPLEYRITLDNGNKLLPVASGSHYPWYYYGSGESILKTGDRILINFTVLGDKTGDNAEIEAYYVRVNSVKKILLKGILDITEENSDSIGNDPVVVSKYWMTDSLLNFEIKYRGRYEIHYINLVKEPGELTADDQPVELELRHNENDDNRDFSYTAYVSFQLNAIRIAGLDSVEFRVTSTDYDGKLFEYEGVYHYGQTDE